MLKPLCKWHRIVDKKKNNIVMMVSFCIKLSTVVGIGFLWKVSCSNIFIWRRQTEQERGWMYVRLWETKSRVLLSLLYVD